MPERIIPASYNDHFIKSLKWDGKDTRLLIGDCLMLQLRKTSKTWLVRRRLDGEVSTTTIGKYPDMSLKRARIESAKITTASTISAVTVEQLVIKYMDEVAHRKHKRPALAQG
jgi:hypothetical protein